MFLHKLLLTIHVLTAMDPIPAAEPFQAYQNTYIEVDPIQHRLRLYADDQLMKTFPIALGKPNTPSPVGEYMVINKYKNWGKGFGTRWIGLNVPWGIYGIHGTNRPDSIGHSASHGCIRMYNHHVEELYEWVRVGTTVSFGGHVLGKPLDNPRLIAMGDSGGDVQLLQWRLRSEGLYSGECKGKFNYATEVALKAYEQQHNLPVDGVAGYEDYLSLGLIE
ncbi:L,D-transpeptidase family protein [Paenibacillus massiliensis]|uniref:L,D-transpeptidase family protein n=1 Tax=Paenibacillus massiliensis TaxID=225917 RepID=UPI00040E5BD7|nr:L,D-transpeptidase family protein [Paenibacillus massiliensis]